MKRCIIADKKKAESNDCQGFLKHLQLTRGKWYPCAAILMVLGLWWGLSKMYSALVVPPIGLVVKRILEILSTPKLWLEIGKTITRLIQGLALGMGIGCMVGLIGGLISPVKLLLQPVLGIIQVVPPISWLILAIIWFGLNGTASIFIVVMAVVPTMFICVSDGILAIDQKLLEMGQVFEFSLAKRIRYIMIPSVAPYFGSGLKIAVGTACKTVVMGEVLTTTTGIGGQIMTARLNIEPETVIAWTVIVVGIYYLTILLGRTGNRLTTMVAKKNRRGSGCWK